VKWRWLQSGPGSTLYQRAQDKAKERGRASEGSLSLTNFPKSGRVGLVLVLDVPAVLVPAYQESRWWLTPEQVRAASSFLPSGAGIEPVAVLGL